MNFEIVICDYTKCFETSYYIMHREYKVGEI
jgi:hypothetical protein